MPAKYTLDRKLDAKRLGDGLAEFLRHWIVVELTERSLVTLNLYSTHAALMRLVAGILPADAPGFERLSADYRAMSAGELLADTLDSGASTTPMGYGATWIPPRDHASLATLIRGIRDLRPDAQRRSTVSVSASRIRWKGAPDASSGELMLSDARSRGKVRFQLTASVELDDALSKSERAAALARIEVATGIDFSKGKLERTEPEDAPRPTALDLAPASLAADHCVEALARQLLATGFDWRSLPGCHPNDGALGRRMGGNPRAPENSLGQPRFRWDTRLTQFVRSIAPELRRRSGVFDDAISWFGRLDEGWDWALIFDTHPGRRSGRVFKLRVGVCARAGALAGFRRSGPLLACSGGAWIDHDDACPEFAYDSEDDLDALLAGLAPFLESMLPRWVALLREEFLPMIEDPAHLRPLNGALSCREAVALARQRLAETGRAGLELTGARLGDVITGFPLDEVDPPDGRLSPAHHWSIRFDDDGEILEVKVPHAGFLRIGRWESAVVSTKAHLAPLAGGWMDSPEAARLVATSMARHAARHPDMTGRAHGLMLATTDGLATWSCHLDFRDGSGGFAHVEPRWNAVTGASLGTGIDESAGG